MFPGITARLIHCVAFQSIAVHQSRSPLYSPSRDEPCTVVLSQLTLGEGVNVRRISCQEQQLEGESVAALAWRPLLVSARLNHCVAFQSISCNQSHSLVIHPVSRTHVRVSHSPTTFSPCPALSCCHTHIDSRSLSRWLPHARCLAYTHLRTLSRLNALSPCATLSCPHIVSRSHWLALFRFTPPRSTTLPFVWLSHWLSIMLCHSCHALLSHAPPSNYLALTITHVLSRTVAHWAHDHD